jgi:hypothetical protein
MAQLRVIVQVGARVLKELQVLQGRLCTSYTRTAYVRQALGSNCVFKDRSQAPQLFVQSPTGPTHVITYHATVDAFL